jgi:putative endonuclease
MTVYLIHFDRPLGDPNNPRGQAQHYIGYADNLAERIVQHWHGNGAKIIAAAVAAGITWSCVRTWPGDRKLERKLKNLHNAPRLCPVCRRPHR